MKIKAQTGSKYAAGIYATYYEEIDQSTVAATIQKSTGDGIYLINLRIPMPAGFISGITKMEIC